MKTGILGGTFDPVHLGHLAIADEVKKTLELDEVIFIPAGQPPFKTGYELTPPEKRLEMLSLAVADRPQYKTSRIELERLGPSYTVDTLAELRRQHENADEFYFIMGWDSLEDFPAWREPSRIINLCTLVAVPRPGRDKPDMNELEKGVPGISKRVIFLDGPLKDVSASAIRAMMALGESIDHLVPKAVADYIREHGLYQSVPGV